jgi:hypothetical protein
VLLEGVYLSIPLFLHYHIYHLSFRSETINSFKAFAQDIDLNTLSNTTALELTINNVLFSFCSIYGGFVRWQMGVKEDGSDSIAIQVADENVRAHVPQFSRDTVLC